MTPIALTIAGSDSGGGAGIQADLKTFSALGVYGASVVTALTAQNTKGVSAIHDVPAQFVAAQMDAVFSDLDVGAVKIGMVSQRGVIEAIAAGLERWRQDKIVLDPVMIAASGDKLLAADAIETLKRALRRSPATRARCASKASGCSRWGRGRCWSKAGMAAAPRASIS
jgi:hydroxymethylpyrimidine/phosphomethylpyrimidine kinase